MDENDSERQFEDFSSNITGVSKKQKLNKIILIGIMSFFAILILIIILIILALKNSGDSNNNSLGEIICIYDIKSINKDVHLLGDEYIKDSNFDIFIDKQKIKYSKNYKFSKAKKYNVIYKIYENINMNYMFKNISSLISVELKSNKNVKITSMISTFEECSNLESFKINGFDTNYFIKLHFIQLI